MNYKDIKDFSERCETHPDHQDGIVSNLMLVQRMHEEIDELRAYIEGSSCDPKERLIRIMGTFDLATGHADTLDELIDSLESELRDVLGHYRTAREWVGLTDMEKEQFYNEVDDWDKCVDWVEDKLKEKNT